VRALREVRGGRPGSREASMVRWSGYAKLKTRGDSERVTMPATTLSMGGPRRTTPCPFLGLPIEEATPPSLGPL